MGLFAGMKFFLPFKMRFAVLQRRALYDTIWWNENELCIESHVMKRLPIMIHLIKRLLVPRSPIHKTIPLGMGGGEE